MGRPVFDQTFAWIVSTTASTAIVGAAVYFSFGGKLAQVGHGSHSEHEASTSVQHGQPMAAEAHGSHGEHDVIEQLDAHAPSVGGNHHDELGTKAVAHANSSHEPAAENHGAIKGHGEEKTNHHSAKDEQASHGHEAPHWGYVGETDADHWAELNPEWDVCANGRRQSPINITATTASASSDPIFFGYQNSPGKLLNNGHTVQLSLNSPGWIQVDSHEFNFAQFHFHTPSEHSFFNQQYPGELHLVHKSPAGDLAVVGLMLKPGKENKALNGIIEQLPAKANVTASLKAFDIATLLPQDHTYYSYVGSLTTPPCSEGVRWMVMTQPIELSPQQLRKLASTMGENARPVQPLYGRQPLLKGTPSRQTAQAH